jgi:hypothetical protein
VGEGRLVGGPARRAAQPQREEEGGRGGEADGWDRLGVGPTGRERRERALTRGHVGFN